MSPFGSNRLSLTSLCIKIALWNKQRGQISVLIFRPKGFVLHAKYGAISSCVVIMGGKSAKRVVTVGLAEAGKARASSLSLPPLPSNRRTREINLTSSASSRRWKVSQILEKTRSLSAQRSPILPRIGLQLRGAGRKPGRRRRWGGISQRGSSAFQSYQPGSEGSRGSQEVKFVAASCRSSPADIRNSIAFTLGRPKTFLLSSCFSLYASSAFFSVVVIDVCSPGATLIPYCSHVLFVQ